MISNLSWRGILFLLLILLIVNIVTVSIGSDQTTLTVSNRTDHFLHIFIEGQSFLYVAPERSVTYSSDPKPTILASVLYAPGQGIHGSATDTISIPYTGAREGCTCKEGSTWGECEYTPPTGGSARWEITSDDMIAEEELTGPGSNER